MEPEDRYRYLETLDTVKKKTRCQVYAYCLMRNHVHLVLAEGDDDNIGEIMRRLGSSYVYWYNHKYERVGYLFQDRFLSEPIESEPYLIAAVRYVHQNPIKAGITTECAHYVWSSYLAYTTGKEHRGELTDTAFALGVTGGLQQFVEFHGETSKYDFQDVEDSANASTAEVLAAVQLIMGGHPVGMLKEMNPTERNRVLRELKTIPGVSSAKIARLVGLGRKVVERA